MNQQRESASKCDLTFTVLLVSVLKTIINAITCRKVSFKAGQKFQTKFRKSIMIASLNVKLSMNSKKYILMALNGFLFLLKEISNAENRRRGKKIWHSPFFVYGEGRWGAIAKLEIPPSS